MVIELLLTLKVSLKCSEKYRADEGEKTSATHPILLVNIFSIECLVGVYAAKHHRRSQFQKGMRAMVALQ
jgi:hypothetical protein